jgi:hypothetical protein
MFVPKDLKRSLPRFIQEFVDRKVAFGIFAFLYVVVAYGLAKQSNLWLFFLPTSIGPLLGGLVYVFVPYDPYRNLFARKQGITEPEVQNDPAAQHLLALLRSNEARCVVIRTSILSALIFCLAIALIALLSSRPLGGNFGLDQISWLAISTWFFWMLSLGVQVHFLLRWAIQKYAHDQQRVGQSE